MNFPKEAGTLHVFDTLESEVRSYCRSFQAVFDKARNAKVWDVKGNEYIDFFAGAGALNYGHNNPAIRHKLIGYMLDDGVTHSLDMATKAKEAFLTRFNKSILKPRGLDYKIMFPGPTGTNSVESALKIARKATGRTNIICFTNAFHGMSLGSLAATGNTFKRKGAGVDLPNTTFMPYDGYLGERIDTAEILAKLLGDPGSGVDLPAAVILETVQGEGGLNVAGFAWLRRIEALCRKHDILLIVDDVQMGCGRTGSFFSFEGSGIEPDIVCLSKSIGGYGLPLALTLIKPEYDLWSPGEHNGTFRGNNLGFVAASEALSYWEKDTFKIELAGKIRRIHNALEQLLADHPQVDAHIKGRGMIQGISFAKPELAARLSAAAFKNGVIMETSGPYDEVAKLMPPLTIEPSVLEEGLAIIRKSFVEVVQAEPVEAIV
ncbi:diaminobutyrate--2-oxoglutarate transaminase [Paenibacillus sp. sptzw28]|uniref:diaminobutyrate--2-oxoglutarate transaminase n=1 Tax=Paenibacillus sp. sptzw28 TaxID=715179 RepID=UPI001C6DF6AE|nr:diaminobutyrate--2-oxoglutarate transaminase [Paenibacillus sp. sptzw28]QYR22573.1 diaminobutyrate--2-oxoglutarate transaminase [Paenibacillus sp. sptzw28]